MNAIEKYGVEEELVKRGEKDPPEKCPKCGAWLEKKGQVWWCHLCGTEPFEGGDHGKKEA